MESYHRLGVADAELVHVREDMSLMDGDGGIGISDVQGPNPPCHPA